MLTLVIRAFIMHSVTFISSTSQDRIKLIFSHTNKSYIFREQFLLLAPMITCLKDLTQSIGRYGGLSWQNWFKGIWKHKQYFYLVLRIGQHEGERQTQHGRGTMTTYFISDVRKHNSLCCLPCPTSTLQHVIF